MNRIFARRIFSLRGPDKSGWIIPSILSTRYARIGYLPYSLAVSTIER